MNTSSVPAQPRLTDGVIVLDALTVDDVDAQVAGEDEEQARRFGWYPARSTSETVRTFILQVREDWLTDAPRRAFAMRDPANGTLLGGCEIRLKKDGVAEMSYWTFPAYRRRGLATRAVQLACAYAFDELAVNRMELRIEPDNQASREVARRAGFVQEGLLRKAGVFGEERRDMVPYSRLASV